MGTPVVFRRDDNGEPIIPNRYLSLFNNTTLGANATYSQPWIDSTLTFFMDKSGYAGPQDVNFVSGSALADQSGTLYLDQTDDSNTAAGNASNYFSTSVAVSVSTLTEFPLTNLKHKWYRFRYVNGATAQTSFELGQMSERIDAFDQIALAGSKGAVPQDANGNLGVTLGTALSSTTDSVAVGAMPKGPIYTMFNAVTATGASSQVIDGRGYNAVIVSISVTGATTGGQLTLTGISDLNYNGVSSSYYNVYDSPGTGAIQSTGANFNTTGIFIMKPLPDKASMYLSRTDGTWTVYAQPIVLGG